MKKNVRDLLKDLTEEQFEELFSKLSLWTKFKFYFKSFLIVSLPLPALTKKRMLVKYVGNEVAEKILKEYYR